jgi:hypothetical protein
MARLKRWQWIVIGLVVGLAAGMVAANFWGREVESLGSAINNQQRFEQSLHPYKYRDEEVPRWKDVRVLRVNDPGGRNGMSYVVIGLNYTPSVSMGPRRTPEGKLDIRWVPTMYVAPSPYTPLTPVAAAAPARAPLLRRLAEWLQFKEPEEPNSVVDYLTAVGAARPDFTFTYQWWKRPRMTVATWTAGSVLVIGGIWPFLASLLAFGRLVPPREEKGIDLSKVRNTPTAPLQQRPTVTATDIDHLRQIEAAMAARLDTAQPAATPAPTPPAAPAPPPTRLAGGALEAAPEQHQPDAEFETKDDDFYPTEKRGRRGHG